MASFGCDKRSKLIHAALFCWRVLAPRMRRPTWCITIICCWARLPDSMAMRLAHFLLLVICAFALAIPAQGKERPHPSSGSEEGFGRVHMDISCAPAVAPEFDRALALLHNFWYARALERFNQVIKKDSRCAVAYWGAAMTYNHPF
jgi:hypothetical protein